MATKVTQVLSLGNFRTELDDRESKTGAENHAALTGKTFGSTDAPLWRLRTQMTMVDADNDGAIDFADKTIGNRKDYIQFSTPSGVSSRTIDTGLMYSATLTYTDGTSATANVRIIQDGEGNLHILPPPNTADRAEVQALTTKHIQSITIGKMVTNNYESISMARFGLPDDPTFICFSAETQIRTDRGETAAGELSVGDLVATAGGPAQAIRWIGKRHIDAAFLAHLPNLLPIRIRAGALGPSSPSQDLLLSQQHRVLIRSKIAERMFGASEVLVAAKHLCELDGVEVAEDVTEVTYVHFLFEKHQVIFANGAEAESMFTGAQSLQMVGPEAKEEILTLFPELAAPEAQPVPARPLLRGKDARKLAQRIAQKRLRQAA